MSKTLLKQVRDQIKARIAERDSLLKEMDVRKDEADSIIHAAEEESRDMDAKESARFNELREQLATQKDRLDEIGEDVEELEQRADDLAEYEEIRRAATSAAENWSERDDDHEKAQRNVRVTKEPRTYTPDSERRGVSFYRDLYNRHANSDHSAGERLERHQREARMNEAAEYRDVGTSAFAGLTVPQYLTDLVAPLARAMAPTVEIANRHPLPSDGLTVNISRITTGTATGAQSAEGDAATETNADDTVLSVNVRTYTGQQDVSRQALERSTGVDDILTTDLVRAYWTTLDDAVLNADGTNGTHLGIRSTSSIASVVYADGTPTAAELYPKLANLISDVQGGVFMGLSHFVMHPRRWWWLASQLGSQPFLTVPGAGVNQAGQVGGTEYAANNRNILGVPVVLDGNIPTTQGGGTNEDVILGVTDSELHLWHDDGPMFIRAEQPGAGTLQVKFVVYSYSAFTAGRYPGAHGTVTSTGLVAPSF